MRYLLTGILAGLIMFAWTAVSWMALPLHAAALNNFPTATTDADLPMGESSIDQLQLPKSGVYHYPGFPHHEDGSPVSDAELNKMFERMKAGPTISLLVYHADGREPFPPKNFAIGIGSCIVASWIATWLTWLAAPRLRSYGRRVLFVTALGAFVFFAFYAQSWLWWGYSSEFGIAGTIDIIVAPMLAGLVIAKLVNANSNAAQH